MMRRRQRTLLLGGVVAIAAAMGGFVVGEKDAERADWHTATVQVYGGPERPIVSVEVDGWTYAIEGSVPRWIDADGTRHGNGWPACLEPEPVGTSTQKPREVPIRFAALDVEVDGLAWREVVAVDCGPASSPFRPR
ncbi:MAG: hypothetical protein GEU97_09165 [Actinophytocola sp.]|nr:hypothetical protein [Actinophytocola sp.]